MLVIKILRGTPELSAAFLLFYRQIMTFARNYDWSNRALPLASECLRSPLDPSNWKVGPLYKARRTQLSLSNCCIRTGFSQQYSRTSFCSQAMLHSDTTSYGLPRTQDTSRIPNSLLVPVIHLCRQIWSAIKRHWFQFSAPLSLCLLCSLHTKFLYRKVRGFLYIRGYYIGMEYKPKSTNTCTTSTRDKPTWNQARKPKNLPTANYISSVPNVVSAHKPTRDLVHKQKQPSNADREYRPTEIVSPSLPNNQAQAIVSATSIAAQSSCTRVHISWGKCGVPGSFEQRRFLEEMAEGVALQEGFEHTRIL